MNNKKSQVSDSQHPVVNLNGSQLHWYIHGGPMPTPTQFPVLHSPPCAQISPGSFLPCAGLPGPRFPETPPGQKFKGDAIVPLGLSASYAHLGIGNW